ncbi:MAG: hypothetical protein U0R71_07910 [Solirubrobacterales bacterium]
MSTICAALLAGAALLAIAAPAANADFGIKKWEAGTCSVPDVPPAVQCTYGSPDLEFFTQAAGHPVNGNTDFEVNTGGLLGSPEGTLSKVRVDLPEGLNVNPQAVPQCPKATFEASPASCAASKVGTSTVYSVSSVLTAPVTFDVYNIVPDPGTPALFGFDAKLELLGLGLVDLGDVYLVADIDWAHDYHEGFTIENIPSQLPLVRNRLVFEGTAGNSFITMPSPCNGDTTTGLQLTSTEGKTDSATTTPAGPGHPVPIVGCEKVPFNPSISAGAGAVTDSPAAVTANLSVPQSTPDHPMPINSSTVKQASVSLPLGAGLNPSAAEGLLACGDAEFHKGQTAPVACPPGSQIGTVSIQTPVLPANSLPGVVYLGKQLSRDPESGNEYRIFIDAESPRYGISVRLVGNVYANATTGQLTAVVKDAPQVTFSDFTLSFQGGDKAPLTSPPICGPNTLLTSIVPWSGQAVATPSSDVVLTNAPGGGPCAKTMAERPFAPGFDAAPKSGKAATYTPFRAQLNRPQGQQELKTVDVTLPPGATAKLKGIPYCKPDQLDAAAASAGAAEKKDPSCPAKSKVGVAAIRAGTGSSPLQLSGKVYLAGPYQGAQLSLAVITPAVAGPFDLGTVLVRVPVFLDPETAQIHAVAQIPDVYGGAKLDIRSIFLNLNRKGFTLNGTHCGKLATTGTLAGGGADPANPAAFSAFPVSVPFQATGCRKLKFKPKLKLKLFGATHRTQHPKLRAALRTRPGQANIARASVALPHAIFLDQASLGSVCNRERFATDTCPKNSIYGHAKAWSPLLGKPLKGPVVLRPSKHTLPDMVAHLRGQVTIDLVGRIDSYKGGIRTTFDRVPDVPVEKFVLTLPGGKHGLLVASENLCRKPPQAIVQLKGQNGRKANHREKLRSTACPKQHGGKKRHRGTHR